MTDNIVPSYQFDRIDRRTKKVTPALIAAVTDRIVRILQPRQVILFGSQASRWAGEGSDIDLLICLDDHHPLAKSRRGERAGAVMELFRYRSFGLDVIVLTQDEIRRLQEANEGEWDLVLEILAEGKTLFTQPFVFLSSSSHTSPSVGATDIRARKRKSRVEPHSPPA